MTTNTSAAERSQLHALVDALPDSELTEASRLLRALGEVDPVVRAALSAPLDDEPFTDEDRKAVEAAEVGFQRGEWVTNEEMKRELGL
jgi:hypothetical protein